MKLLASDYDGTLAHQGRIEPAALEAVRKWRAAGNRFAIVTGRKLEDLFGWFEHRDLLDAVAAEDGAVLWNAATDRVRTQAAAPPPLFFEELRRRRIPFDAGRVVVYTARSHALAMMETATQMGMSHHVIYNYDAALFLPLGIDKGAGVNAVARALGMSIDDTAVIGDAENDLPLFMACRTSAAVANAIPAVKSAASMVVKGERGRGVAQFVDHLLSRLTS